MPSRGPRTSRGALWRGHGGAPALYNPLVDPAIIDWLTADASAVMVSKKLGLTVTLAGTTPPVYSATGLNGQPCVSFVNGRAKFSIGSSLSGKAKLAFVCSIQDQISDLNTLSIPFEYGNTTDGTGDGTGASISLFRIDTQDIVTEMWAGSDTGAQYSGTTRTSNLTLTFPRVVTFQGDASAANNNPSTLRVNGIAYTSTRPFTQSWTAAHFGNFVLSIGARGQNGSFPWVGKIRDMLIVDNSAASPFTLAQRENFVAARAGIGGNLPAVDGLLYMPLGDSNCEGVGSQTHANCWRNLLAQGWASPFANAVSIGSSQLNPGTNPNGLNHNGISGNTLNATVGNAPTWAGGAQGQVVYEPSVVVLALGTNDLALPTPVATCWGYLQSIVSTFTAAIPRIRFVFVIPGRMNPTAQGQGDTLVQQYRTFLLGASGLSTLGVQYGVVDIQAILGAWSSIPSSGAGNYEDYPSVDATGVHYGDAGHLAIYNGANGSPGLAAVVQQVMGLTT